MPAQQEVCVGTFRIEKVYLQNTSLVGMFYMMNINIAKLKCPFSVL